MVAWLARKHIFAIEERSELEQGKLAIVRLPDYNLK